MFTVMYAIVMIGLAVGLVALAVAMAEGRAEPQRRIPWIVALVILGVDTLLHIVASVGLTVAVVTEGASVMDGAWLLMGTGGFLAILAVAVLRPRLAGWALLASAVAVPILLALGGLTVQPDSEGAVPWPVALVTYSVPAAVTGGLLLLSMMPRRGRADERQAPREAGIPAVTP